jgi:hypothetical protein
MGKLEGRKQDNFEIGLYEMRLKINQLMKLSYVKKEHSSTRSTERELQESRQNKNPGSNWMNLKKHYLTSETRLN